jgi:hypothetical protein
MEWLITVFGLLVALGISAAVMWQVAPMLKSASRLMDGAAAHQTLRANGVPANAQVLRCWETGAYINNLPVVGVHMAVTRPGAAPYEAMAQCPVSQLHLHRLQPHAWIPVKIDPRNPAAVAVDL